MSKRNGTATVEVDPLVKAREIIAQEVQSRVEKCGEGLQELLTKHNCELRVIIQIGNQAGVLKEIAGLPVAVQIVAK